MKEEILKKIEETINVLSEKISKETGEKIVILYGITDGKNTIEGGVVSGEPDWATVSQLSLGALTYVSDFYAREQCRCECLSCEFCEEN